MDVRANAAAERDDERESADSMNRLIEDGVRYLQARGYPVDEQSLLRDAAYRALFDDLLRANPWHPELDAVRSLLSRVPEESGEPG